MKRRVRVTLHPRRREEGAGDQERVQTERLVEEKELRGKAEQRSEREGGDSVSLEHAIMVETARAEVIARARRSA